MRIEDGSNADVETSENPIKKPRPQHLRARQLQRGRRDSNPQPPDRQSDGLGFVGVSGKELTEDGNVRSTCGSTSTRKKSVPNKPTDTAPVGNQADSGDFAKALLMIATLSLTDAEKAEAVRRLMAGRETV